VNFVILVKSFSLLKNDIKISWYFDKFCQLLSIFDKIKLCQILLISFKSQQKNCKESYELPIWYNRAFHKSPLLKNQLLSESLCGQFFYKVHKNLDFTFTTPKSLWSKISPWVKFLCTRSFKLVRVSLLNGLVFLKYNESNYCQFISSFPLESIETYEIVCKG
jgi:hypothetical protein